MKQKYIPNDFIDNQLRTVYAERRANGRKGALRLADLAAKVKWPSHALKQRARALGIASTKELPWTEPEVALLYRHAHFHPGVIWKKFRAAGYARTQTAILLKLKRTHARTGTDYYTQNGLAHLLGCDPKVVGRWIKLGYMTAIAKQSERTPQQGGDILLIHEHVVREFILRYPMVFDLRKVTDQLWFLNLITEGRIAENA